MLKYLSAAVLAALLAAPSTPGRSDATWIVVFDHQPDPLKDPLINIRVVIRAESEGEAVMKATLYLEKRVDGIEKMKFVEVALKKN